MPTALWLIWYLGWGHNAETFISFTNFARSPSYMLDGLSASVATWVGLGTLAYDVARSTGAGRSWSWRSDWSPGASTSSGDPPLG